MNLSLKEYDIYEYATPMSSRIEMPPSERHITRDQSHAQFRTNHELARFADDYQQPGEKASDCAGCRRPGGVKSGRQDCDMTSFPIKVAVLASLKRVRFVLAAAQATIRGENTRQSPAMLELNA